MSKEQDKYIKKIYSKVYPPAIGYIMTWDFTREQADEIFSDCITSFIMRMRQKGSINQPESYIWMTLRKRLARLAKIRTAEQKALDNYDPGDLIFDPYLETDIMEKKEIMYTAMRSLIDKYSILY